MIKPLPIHLRKHLTQKKFEKLQNDDLEGSSSDGDEMFLDREISLGQDQIAKDGFPLGEDDGKATIHPHHVVYRRQSHDNTDTRFSDFGKPNMNHVR